MSRYSLSVAIKLNILIVNVYLFYKDTVIEYK